MSATSLSTGLLTANTSVSDHRDYLNGLVAQADGTNAATITVYDSLTASGKIITKVVIPAGQNTKELLWNRAVRVDNGIFVAVSGTGAAVNIYYGAS